VNRGKQAAGKRAYEVRIAGKVITGIRRRLSTIFFGPSLLALIGLTLLPGCGVKSGPVPPQMVHPAAISDLRASADPVGINLTWSRPMHYVSGHSMRDLGGFVLLRGGKNQPFQPLVELPVTDQERFSPQRTYSYVDGETQTGNSYRYEIVSRTTDGYTSAPSNEVEFTRAWPRKNLKPQNFALPAPSPLPTN
jgi:hypothetical protein